MIHRNFQSTTALIAKAAALLSSRRRNVTTMFAAVTKCWKNSAVLSLRWTGYPEMSRVLLVSHDDHLRAAASRALARAGWNVTTASHAGHASLACVGGPAFDVLVVENQMPESSGRALASRLRRYCPDLQVVRLCEAGVSPAGTGIAVVRPFTTDHLIDAVLRAASAIPVA